MVVYKLCVPDNIEELNVVDAINSNAELVVHCMGCVELCIC